MTSLMTGFILNGLSESLLSSRLFRIKAWVLQVPFLSMIFLYFFDYSNLNHSKVFYLFLYIFYSLAVSLSFSVQSRIPPYLIYTMYISRDFHSFILSFFHLFLFGLSLCLFFTQNLFQKRHNLCFSCTLPCALLNIVL